MADTDPYSVRTYQTGDEANIVELLQLAYHGWPEVAIDCSPLDHWRWKFLDNPVNKSILVVATANGEIVGCNHGLTIKVRIGGKPLMGFQGVDVAVHPDFRKLGVSQGMRQLSIRLRKEAGVNYSYMITQNPIVYNEFRKIWKYFPRPVYDLIRVKDVDQHVDMTAEKGTKVKRYGFKTLKAARGVENVLTGTFTSPKPTPNLNISKISRFDEAFDLLWEETKDYYNFIVERDIGYLNWRYGDERGGKHISMQAEVDGRVLGYIIFRIDKKQGHDLGYIVDLTTMPDRLDAAHALISAACSYFDEKQVNTVHYWTVQGHPYIKSFNRHGFINSRSKIHVFYLPIVADDAISGLNASPKSRLHFQMGDYI